MLSRFYTCLPGQRRSFEECFYVGLERILTPSEFKLLKWLLAGPVGSVSTESDLEERSVVEIGPRLSVETPFSSNAVAICKSVGLPVYRVEKSRRFQYGPGLMISSTHSRDEVIQQFLDPMTEQIYETPLTDFGSHQEPEPVRTIDILGRGVEAMHEANITLGLGMDAWDEGVWTEFFVQLGRNPTDVELIQIGNGNSEHSRHPFFRDIQVIDGKEMPMSLMDLLQTPLKKNVGNSTAAFNDNAGAIRGYEVDVLLPRMPGTPSLFGLRKLLLNSTATAETHNHPTLVAPFPGAATGAGGRIRDSRAIGRGGSVHAGFSGFAVGNIEDTNRSAYQYATPREVLIKGSNGKFGYGNEYGEPVIGGFARSFDLVVEGKRRAFVKPILYSAGLGRVFEIHRKKRPPEVKMLVVQIGGPAYRIGVGGGSASSQISGSQSAELDFKSVQRGNPEMKNRVNRVIQACIELLENNPIESIHDQGAGGPSNVLTELIEALGGRINIRAITVGDRTMSVLEIWVAEYQERYGLLVRPENLPVLMAICKRENVACEQVGYIDGSDHIVVEDPVTQTTPVNLPIKKMHSGGPRKRFASEHQPRKLEPLVIPQGLTIEEALQIVFRQLAVGSKGFLTRKVDRSVTGLIARQQCCGPMQVPVSDVAVTADGYFGLTGAAGAIGENPNRILVNPSAGARMAVAEMLTNMMSAKITRLEDIKSRVNWMWTKAEGAALWDAAVAIVEMMIELGIAIDGGKDSLSMAARLGMELVASPGQVVIFGYAPVPDITHVVTPDLKGSGFLGHISIGGPYRRLGGSAFAQALGQVGDDVPDLDRAAIKYMKRVFRAVQELIERKLITAYHDVSDGGLITTIAEMCIAGNRGAQVRYNPLSDPFSMLFSEEAGVVVEYAPEAHREINRVMNSHEVSCDQVGIVDSYQGGVLSILSGKTRLFDRPIVELRQWWEETSTQLEYGQANRETVAAEKNSHARGWTPRYRLSFTPTAPQIRSSAPPKVAVVREEGTNGDREMVAALYTAGLEPYDISMSDLRAGTITSLDEYRMIVYPGGFSYADVLGSAWGWAASIRFNPRIAEMFAQFYARDDTFSLGVCNGCQLMANIGWILGPDLPEPSWPRFVQNVSNRFESRWLRLGVEPNPPPLLEGMEGSILGIWGAHGEGQTRLDPVAEKQVREQKLAALVYVDPDGNPTEEYPHNPNGSPNGIAGISSPDRRHLAMMPHPERSFLPWQWAYWPEEFGKLEASPWLRMFENARRLCLRG